MSAYSLQINKTLFDVQAEPEMPLLWVLRDLLNLTGTKFGCGVGMCGACTVLVDGEALRSCLLPISSISEKSITTIEGLSEDGGHPIQEAWLTEAVPQCGYCQPGKIMSAAALLTQTPHPTDPEIDSAYKDHLCRCGSYLRIRRAIHRVAEGG